jgi:predicted phosphodiesterase
MREHFMKGKIPYLLLSTASILSVSAFFGLVAVIYGISKADVTAPPMLGNGPENLARIEGQRVDPQPFCFLVVGDTKTSNAFENFYNNARLQSVPDFGVIMGDFVAKPEINRHRFFMHEFSEWGMTFPIILVAGNHDMITNNDIVKRRVGDFLDPFSERDFEKTYGPTNFSFTHAGCLFVVLNDVYNDSYIDYATEILSRKDRENLMTFVFMHIPPQSLSPVVQGRGIAREEEFFNLMEEHRVDYVFCGDFHSYFRSDDNHTNYIVTGGGGSNLCGGSEQSFYHVLLLMVDPRARKVDEIIHPIENSVDLGDDVEIVMLCWIFPFFEGHPFVWVAVFTFGTVIAGGLFVFTLIRLLNKKRGPRHSRTH